VVPTPNTTVEIAGYGPVRIRGLTEAEIKRCPGDGSDEEFAVFCASLVSHGLTDPRFASDDDFTRAFAGKPDVLDQLLAAIVAASWHPGGES
jgi:hypothetical protein